MSFLPHDFLGALLRIHALICVAQQIVDDAEAQADSYFARRYATPIDVTAHSELADIISARVADLAEYIAWRQSPFVGDISDRVRALYDELTK